MTFDWQINVTAHNAKNQPVTTTLDMTPPAMITVKAENSASLPITRWHYTNDTLTTHLGPMAQDFRAAFAVGHDDKGIATVDADGVALAAIQGLNQKVEEQRAENAELKRRLEKLEQMINRQDGGAK